MNKLYTVVSNIGACFIVVGFAACRLVGEVLNLVGLGFSTLGYYCELIADKLNALAVEMFDREPKKETDEQEEFTWIPET
jgi:hypothetical protein